MVKGSTVIGIATVGLIGLAGYVIYKNLGGISNFFKDFGKIPSLPSLPTQGGLTQTTKPADLPNVPVIDFPTPAPSQRFTDFAQQQQAFTIRTPQGTLTRAAVATPALGKGNFAGIRGNPLPENAVARYRETYAGVLTTPSGGSRNIAGSKALFDRLASNLAKPSSRGGN